MIRINLVPIDVLAKEQSRLQMVQVGLAGGLVVLLMAGVSFGHWWNKHKVEMALQEQRLELDKLQEIVKQVEELETTQKAVKARLAEVVTLSKGRPLYPYFMEDLARSLPAGVWLTQLTTSPGPAGTLLALSLGASSNSYEDVADWIRNLEGSGRFEKVKLGAVSGAPTGGGMSFTLTTNYKNDTL